MNICKCSANYNRTCLFPEEYGDEGCVSGKEWRAIKNLFESTECGKAMNTFDGDLSAGGDSE